MKKTLILLLLLICTTSFGQIFKFTEASDLTLVGKICPGTSNPYHRVDTAQYKGFTAREKQLVIMSSGLAVSFRTNSTRIHVQTKFGHRDNSLNANKISARGYDLYIQKDGKWLYAGSNTPDDSKLEEPVPILKNMDGSWHDCLLYLPTYSEVLSVKIGIDPSAEIEAAPNPFRHNIAIWGSSFTHGSSTTRSGMLYPAQFARNTGLNMLMLGTSGHCNMQDYFANVLCDADADAFIFDSFSNPSAELIERRMVPFTDRLIAAHPGKPIIFQQTIYRGNRHFNTAEEKKEQDKMDMARKVFDEMKSTPEGRRKYKDVYFIYPEPNGDGPDNTVDGIHPDNHGYTLWAKSIEKPVLKILAKYGIK